MLGIVTALVDFFAPLFLVLSPIISYADQIVSIHRKKSSDGFSLDIPLIMLTASIMKLFFWFGARYDRALLVQAYLTVVVQCILLKVAVDNKPRNGGRDSLAHRPFRDYYKSAVRTIMGGGRPLNFWRWNSSIPYFLFIAFFAGIFTFIQVFVAPVKWKHWYIEFLGYGGLGIEAMLPVPQIIKNNNNRSCSGFRLSVIINWLAGDLMKMSYFFLSTQVIPWPFRLCGIFQACCDVYLGYQFYTYGDGLRLPDRAPMSRFER